MQLQLKQRVEMNGCQIGKSGWSRIAKGLENKRLTRWSDLSLKNAVALDDHSQSPPARHPQVIKICVYTLLNIFKR